MGFRVWDWHLAGFWFVGHVFNLAVSRLNLRQKSTVVRLLLSLMWLVRLSWAGVADRTSGVIRRFAVADPAYTAGFLLAMPAELPPYCLQPIAPNPAIGPLTTSDANPSGSDISRHHHHVLASSRGTSEVRSGHLQVILPAFTIWSVVGQPRKRLKRTWSSELKVSGLGCGELFFPYDMGDTGD